MHAEPERPNVLWIFGEDTSPDYACYGRRDVATPNIDALAASGTLYEHCFVTAPVCSASRSAIMTGRYQTSIGAHHHRSCRDTDLDPKVPLVMDLFRDAGYFTCNSPGPGTYDRSGKTDWNFRRSDAFDGTDWAERPADTPFFAQINYPHTHRMSRDNTDYSVDPRTVDLPPYYPDDELTRRDWALYLASLQRFDTIVGEILTRLKVEGLRDNTIVVLMSDHGRGHVRDKQFLYDGGIHIPCIVSAPGTVDKNARVGQLVSSIDIAATSLSLCDIPIPASLEGIPFLGPDAKTREHIVAARDRCDGTEDRIRCVRTQRHKYIRNFHPERPYMQFNSYKETNYPVWSLLRARATAQSLPEHQARFAAATRPAEELYDLETDPHELDNLAEDPSMQQVLADMRTRLDRWISETGDLGQFPEDSETRAAEREAMAEAYARAVTQRNLCAKPSPDDWLVYWREQMQRPEA